MLGFLHQLSNLPRLAFTSSLQWRPQRRGVSEIQSEIGVSRPNLSQHLAVLKAAGVITTRRNGKQVHVALAIPEVRQACHLIHEVLRSSIRRQRKLASR